MCGVPRIFVRSDARREKHAVLFDFSGSLRLDTIVAGIAHNGVYVAMTYGLPLSA